MAIEYKKGGSEHRALIRIGCLRLTEGERQSAEQSVRNGERAADLVLRAGAGLRSALARLGGLFARLRTR